MSLKCFFFCALIRCFFRLISKLISKVWSWKTVILMIHSGSQIQFTLNDTQRKLLLFFFLFLSSWWETEKEKKWLDSWKFLRIARIVCSNFGNLSFQCGWFGLCRKSQPVAIISFFCDVFFSSFFLSSLAPRCFTQNEIKIHLLVQAKLDKQQPPLSLSRSALLGH